jgi:hypothetical protein
MSDFDDTVAVRYNPLDHLALERSIALRWTLRDILAGRTKFLPLDDTDLQLLIGMGMVEMHDDAPALTESGLAAIE